MSHHHLLFCCTSRVSGKISIARLLVVAVNSVYHILVVHNLSQQLTVQVIEIQMVITVALTGQQDMILCYLHIVEHFLLDVLLYFVLDSQLTHRRQRICHIDTQLVLMAIHRKDSDFRWVAGRFDTWDIAVGIQWHVDLACLATLDIKAVHTYLRVHLSWHGIFIGIVANRVLFNRTLVVANPYKLLRVGREYHRRVGSKFLLIHPVGNTIDNLVVLTVLRDLTLGIVIQQLHQIDVILAHKGYQVTIGRENRRLLSPTLR